MFSINCGIGRCRGALCAILAGMRAQGHCVAELQWAAIFEVTLSSSELNFGPETYMVCVENGL